MRTKRDSLGIITLILESLKENITLTQLMYKARLDSRTAKKYLNLLLDNGLIMYNHYNGSKKYTITEKGSKFLTVYTELLMMVNNKYNNNYNKTTNNYNLLHIHI